MKTINFFSALFLLIAMLQSCDSSSTGVTRSKTIDEILSEVFAANGIEYNVADNYIKTGTTVINNLQRITGDIDQDGNEDLVFTGYKTEEESNIGDFVALILYANGEFNSFTLSFPESNGAFYELTDIPENGGINAVLNEYTPDDPSCCPSKKTKLHLTAEDLTMIDFLENNNK